MSATRGILLVGVGALVALATVVVVRDTMRDERAAQAPPAPAAPPPASVREHGAELTTGEIARRTLPSVVWIKVVARDGDTRIGTGFVVGEHGLVATNHHVVEGAVRIEVTLPDGTTATPSRLVGSDGAVDITLLALAKEGLPVLDLRIDPPVEVGEKVIAIGHPMGLENSVTEGIVSGLRQMPNGRPVIQTSAAISSGNSGGPLLDTRGRVVGVVTFKVLGRGVENLNFAIPAQEVAALTLPGGHSVAAWDYYSHGGQPALARGDGAGIPAAHAGAASEAPLAGTWRPAQNTRAYILLSADGADRLKGKVVELARPLPANERVSNAPDEDITSVMDLDMSRDPDDTWRGTGRLTWSCECTELARDHDGTFRTRDARKKCPLEVSLELRATGGTRLQGHVTRPRMPQRGDRDVVHACCTCLGGWPNETVAVSWTRIGEEWDW